MKTKARGLSIGGLAIAAFAAVALLSYSSTPQAAPDKPSKPKGKITFDQEYVKEFIAPGEVGDYTISITSPTSLDNTVIEIPGSLSTYVTFSPNRITTDSGQRPFVITMTVEIPAETPLGDLEGTLQVKVDDGSNGTIAKPLPVTITVNELGIDPVLVEKFDIADADGNGIWDDVDSYIAANHTDPGVIAALEQKAEALQALILNSDDQEAVNANLDASGDVLYCFYYLDEINEGDGSSVNAKNSGLRIDFFSHNIERGRAYTEAQGLEVGGIIIPPRTLEEKRAYCNFNPDQL